jgi:argininosuccinate synthase
MDEERTMKIVTAYSGGLDTSVMIPWLSENNNGAEIIAYTGDLGQGEDLPAIRDKALRTGAYKAIVEDLQQRFVEDFIWPALKAGALYEGTYPLHTALGRPLLAQRLAEVAMAEGADAIAHGCTAKGNDQVRFEVTVRALAPQLKVIAPLREWELTTRESEIAFAEARNIPIPVTKAKPYSIDRNIWGCAIECGEMEDLWNEPPADAWQMTSDPVDAPAGSEELIIGFVAGVPVSLNGQKLDGVSLIRQLNDIASRYGIGRIDMVENRVVGLKSREVYEAPGASLLHVAHTELERVCLDRATSTFKRKVSHDFANIIYDGLWFTPLREALQAFVEQTQQTVTGEVRLRLSAGLAQVTGRKSPFSLYDEGLATYSHGDTFDRTMATGFLEIYGLSAKTVATMRRRNGLPTAAKEQVTI